MIGDLLDLVWPRRCAVCGRPADRPGRHLCSECLNRIPFNPAKGLCSVCGRAVEGLEGEYLCDDCTGPDRPSFDRAVSAVRYEDAARDMIHGYKYAGQLWLRGDFADWLEGAVSARFDASAVDIVLPMPLTALHRLDRGYNQSGYLARELARRIGRAERGGILVRKGRPRRQAGLCEEDRRENAKGTFAVRHAEFVRGRTVLVVDDIMTTGATLSEAAKALKESGASRVWCATLARSIRA